ncbi:MAG: hypothetical protein KGY60_00980 [Bacteroidales bacterium]|nr:hypothetical protein [Bacteroidales bacterium]
MKKTALKLTALMLGVMFFFASCATHVHTVGSGAQGNTSMEERQWFVLWGLVPLNDVDSREMAGDAQNYTITTEQAPLDVIINIFTTYVTVVSRTVTVEK